MSYSRIIVTDFDRTIKLKVENKSSKDGIVRLKLRLISNIDQPIKMALKCDDQMVREIMLQTGDTKTILVDWYTNHAEIVFLDKTPKSGSIEIRYEFIEI